jgi:hypothetical protein
VDLVDDPEPQYGDRILLFNVRATNRDSSPLNLTIEISVLYEIGGMEPRGSIFHQSMADTGMRLEQDALPKILEIDPGRTKSGLLKLSTSANEL